MPDKAIVRTIIFIAFLLSCAAGFSQDNDCVLKKQADGVKVYTCMSGKEKLRSLRAEFTIKNTTLDQLVLFLKNVKNFPTWQYNMVSAEELAKTTEENIITRSEIRAPWPVSNRELIVEYSFSMAPALDELNVTVKTIDYEYPMSDELVRVPFSDAEWHVVKDGTALNVVYTLRIDPGGNVPAWLVNMAMAEGPYQSFRNLKEQLE